MPDKSLIRPFSPTFSNLNPILLLMNTICRYENRRCRALHTGRGHGRYVSSVI